MAIKRARFHNVVIYDGKCECFLWKLVNVGGYQVKGKIAKIDIVEKWKRRDLERKKKTGEESRVLRIAKRIKFWDVTIFPVILGCFCLNETNK
jgi:hypothetical protein